MMIINRKIWEFPDVPIQSQLFHVPGAAFDGGITSGGAIIQSPEPGGRSVLETQVAFNPNEWDFPFHSWLMSKVNGEIFRIKLTKTPQIVDASGNINSNSVNLIESSVSWNNQQTWNNGQNWQNDGEHIDIVSNSLEGSVKITVDTSTIGEIIKFGHVIGIGNSSYLVDEVEYENNFAELTIKPPLRKSVIPGLMLFLKTPYFLGTISNGNQIRSTYENSNNGGIQMGNIIFNEFIL